MRTSEKTGQQMLYGVSRRGDFHLRTSEKTGHKVFVDTKSNPERRKYSWYKKLRLLKRDPTIKMVRSIWPAPIFAAEWTFTDNGAPEGARDLVKKWLSKIRNKLLRNATYGCIDWGWAPFEIVYAEDREGYSFPLKAKPLLHEITEIEVFEDNGEFAGFVQETDVEVSNRYAVLLSFDEEGTDWYGNSIMAAVEEAYDNSCFITDAGKKYDQKIAGTHWVVHYPPGDEETEVNGQMMNNFELAQFILRGLKSSGGVIVPSTVKAFIDDLEGQEIYGWKIELIEAGTSAANAFDVRNARQDKLKVRAFGIPERSILETKYGTKADAGAHGDFAITMIEFRHQCFCEAITEQLIDEILRKNWGEEYIGTLILKPAPLVDEKRQFLMKLFTDLITKDPELAQREYDSIDWDEFKEILGIPERDDADDPIFEPELDDITSRN